MALDILAVADALHADDLAILGMGAQGAPTVRFATSYPDRVSAIILFNASGLYGANYEKMAEAIVATSRMDPDARMIWSMEMMGVDPEKRFEYRPFLVAWGQQMSPEDYARVLR